MASGVILFKEKSSTLKTKTKLIQCVNLKMCQFENAIQRKFTNSITKIRRYQSEADSMYQFENVPMY
jgi:hypothetical protein